MLKITNVVEIEKHYRKDGTPSYLTIEITLSDNEKKIINYYDDSLEVAKEHLYNINWIDEVINGLERFAEDEEKNYGDDIDHVYFYSEVIKKINNNMELTESEISDINDCIRICSVFIDFDYKTWVLE